MFLTFQLDANLVAKISDFGLSKIKETTIISNTAISTVGSVPWAAPEYLTVKRKNERNEKGDVFSFGVIVWELVTLQTPWKAGNHTIEDIKEYVIEGVRLEMPKCSEKLQNVMKRCWDHGIWFLVTRIYIFIDPAKRPSFGDLVDEFQELNKENLIDSQGMNLEQQELLKVKKALKERKAELGLSSDSE